MKNKNLAYYIVFHGLFWAIYAAGYYAEVVRVQKPSDYWQVVFLVTMAANILALFLGATYDRFPGRSLFLKGVVITLSSVVASIIWAFCKYWVLYEYYAPGTFSGSLLSYLLGNSLAGLQILVFWSVLYFFFDTYAQSQRHRINALTAESLARDSQLKLLSYQLNPHFLFNALNSIATLSLREDRVAAHSAILKLSAFLQFTLKNEPWRKIKLSEELDCLGMFLDIQKMRFSDRMRFKVNVPQDLMKVVVPALILQPLIENAVKHAVEPSDSMVEIVLTAHENDEFIVFTVSNSLPTTNKTPIKSHGIGLQNVSERLLAYYNEKAGITTAINDNQFVATLSIPIETELTNNEKPD